MFVSDVYVNAKDRATQVENMDGRIHFITFWIIRYGKAQTEKLWSRCFEFARVKFDIWRKLKAIKLIHLGGYFVVEGQNGHFLLLLEILWPVVKRLLFTVWRATKLRTGWKTSFDLFFVIHWGFLVKWNYGKVTKGKVFSFKCPIDFRYEWINKSEKKIFKSFEFLSISFWSVKT